MRAIVRVARRHEGPNWQAFGCLFASLAATIASMSDLRHRFGRALRLLHAVLAAAGLAAAAGCADTRPWINQPLQQIPRVDVRDVAQRDASALFAVTLSGGGARAAAFAHGVLLELRDTPCCWTDRTGNMLDAIDLVSGVSGGSIAAAHLAAYGSAGLERFEREFLRQDFQDGLLGQLARPRNLYDLTSPWFGRGHLLQRRLDQLYEGKTYADVERRPRHPQLVVTATDLSLGTGFDFTAEQFALICSDLSSVPLSFAVAASSSVPLVLSPMTLRNYRGACPVPDVERRPEAAGSGADDGYRTRLFLSQERSYLDARARPYVHLVDGGLADNLGVRRLLDRALAGGSMGAAFNEVRIAPGSVRRLVVVIVNAERDPGERIDQSDRVPGTAAVVDAMLFGAGNRATTETQEYLIDLARRWQADLHAGRTRFTGFAREAEIFLVQVNLRDAPEERSVLLQVPTALSISSAEVDGLIAAGRRVLRASPEFQALKKSLEDR